MLKKELADEITHALGIKEPLSDDVKVALYNLCSSCRRPAIPPDDLDLVIGEVGDLDEFIERLDAIDADTSVNRHAPNCPQVIRGR